MPLLRDGESDESDKEKDKVEWPSPTNRTALDVLMIFGGEYVDTIGLHCNRAMPLLCFLTSKAKTSSDIDGIKRYILHPFLVYV